MSFPLALQGHGCANYFLHVRHGPKWMEIGHCIGRNPCSPFLFSSLLLFRARVKGAKWAWKTQRKKGIAQHARAKGETNTYRYSQSVQMQGHHSQFYGMGPEPGYEIACLPTIILLIHFKTSFRMRRRVSL